jgi:hypothetical protein
VTVTYFKLGATLTDNDDADPGCGDNEMAKPKRTPADLR